jgi:hypothetical protein
MHKQVRRAVAARAKHRCEYCLVPSAADPQPMEVEHVIARQHGGAEELDNLALACFSGNRYKGPNLAGIDPATGALQGLFHPRRDAWAAHFRVNGTRIEPLSSTGAVTIIVLQLNHSTRLALREALLEEGVWPPFEKSDQA